MSSKKSAHSREHWGTRIGLILAMAGNAIGLGNFLRFPVQAAENGGGTFMIPYFLSFVLLGIPIMWIEWGIGRHGGRFGEGSVPGMFDRLWNHSAAKYLGVLGLVLPVVVFSYYTVIVGWLLGFSFFSLTGAYFGLSPDGVREFLASFQNIHDTGMHGGFVGYFFFFLTAVLVIWILSRGISGGIEKLALWGMPVLFVFGALLMIRILTLPATDMGSPLEGLAFIWTPDWGQLGNAEVWVAAAGQIFFTLSVGFGAIHAYASYLSKEDDITLAALTTASTNEFAEVVLGGTIAIPAAATFFGVTGATVLAAGGSFDLGFVAMATVFQNLPGGEVWGRLMAFMWFFLLFIAGITSSVAMATPAMSFIQENFGVSRRRAALGFGVLVLALGFANVWWLSGGFLDEWDQWAALAFIVFAFLEVWIVKLAFGMDRFWEEMHLGADLRIHAIFRFVMSWITPLFLTVLLLWYGWQNAVPLIMMEGVPEEHVPTLWIARLFIVALIVTGVILIRVAWRRNPERREGSRSGLTSEELAR